MTSVLALAPQPLIDICHAILRFFHDEVGFDWGASIIGMTVVVRLAILPLTYKGVRGMQAMQRLSPEIKRIQERYKDDKQRQQQEMMKLWQEHKVNPASSCLPLLLQLPFFIALFDLLRGPAFRADIRGDERFLFIEHLAEPAAGAALVTLIVLYVVTMLGSSLVTMSSVTDATQRRIFLAMPIVFIPFILQFPAGLLVYWITTNVWTIGQQLAVKKLLPPPEPLAPSADEDGKGDPATAAVPAGAAAAVPAGAGGERRRFGFLDALNPSSE
ncbi:MAG: YidC/Oxa1 family membrane protein insertase, partial [Actinomycetota bacterium]|nr:YidC/Oxa1 family membrane protein insertase [Actinomycetota bacterium]